MEDLVEALGVANPLLLIDGRSGAGKTTLVERLVGGWPGSEQPQVVALDSVYPGWDGLDAGAATIIDQVIEPFSRGEAGAWPRWDWAHERYAERHEVDPGRPLIVEGVGILQPRCVRLAPIRIWLDAPDAERRARAIARDGATYEPHWERWGRQELAHIQRNSPIELATVVIRLP